MAWRGVRHECDREAALGRGRREGDQPRRGDKAVCEQQKMACLALRLYRPASRTMHREVVTRLAVAEPRAAPTAPLHKEAQPAGRRIDSVYEEGSREKRIECLGVAAPNQEELAGACLRCDLGGFEVEQPERLCDSLAGGDDCGLSD